MLCCALLSALSLLASTNDFSVESIGLQGGFSANEGREEFHRAEGGLNINLPLCVSLGTNWRLQGRMDFSAGWLGDSSLHAFLGSLGPGILVRRNSFRLSFEAGCRPTYISRSEFTMRDLGTQLQFTSFGGMNFDVSSRIRLRYSLQHMSNGGLSSHNPGLNMHMFGLSCLF
jgi:hypothetical protein